MSDLDFEEADDFIDIFKDIDRSAVESSVSEDVDVEKLVMALKNIKRETIFLKKLKKVRVASITEKLDKLDRNESELREIILQLMDELFPKQKTVDFPGVGRVTKRKVTGKWEVTDADKLLEFARKHNKHKDIFQRKFTVKKRELPSILADLIVSGEKVEGAEFVEPASDTSLTVTIHDE